MKYRNLRIAWSVAWGVLAVMLCVLWVRSYRTADEIYGRVSGVADVMGTSDSGLLMLVEDDCGVWPAWAHRTKSANADYQPKKVFGFGVVTSVSSDGPDDQHYFVLPHWLLIATLAAFAAVAWLPWRFSLRTLLIAATVVAVVLGLIVILAR